MTQKISRRKFIGAVTTPALLALSSCGDRQDSGMPEKDIRVLYFGDPPESQFISEELKQFEQETGISVQYKPLKYDSLRPEIDMSFNNDRRPYDVMFVDDIWLREFVEKGMLKELSRFVEQDEDLDEFNKDYSKTILDAEAYYPPFGDKNSKLYLIPHRADVQVLFYNKAIFEDAAVTQAFRKKTQKELHVPETWDEYVVTAKALTGIPYKDGSIIGCAETLKSGHFAFEFFACRYWSMAGEQDFFEKDNNQDDKPIFASPAGVSAIRHFQELLNSGSMVRESMSADHTATITAFQNGQVALCPQWYTFYSTLKSLKDDLGITFLPGVRGQNGNIARTPSIGGGSFGLPSNARTPGKGWAFIKYFTGREFSESSARRGAVVPRTSTYQKPEVRAEIAALEVYRNSLQISRFRPRVAQFSEVELAIGMAIHQAILGPKEQIQQTLEEAASKALSLTKKQ